MRTIVSPKWLVPVVALGLVGIACHQTLRTRNAPETTPPSSHREIDLATSPDLADGEDITKKVSGWAAPGARLPHTEFRAGHVTKRTLDGNALSRTKEGWQAALPSHAPITTPAIHNGKVLTGTEDGKLVAIDTGDRSLRGWVAWGGDAARSGIGR